MNITVNYRQLVHELRSIVKVIPAKAPMPILTHVLLSAEAGLLHFRATDLELAFTTSCQATIVESGNTALPAEKLLYMCERFGDTDVQIVQDKLQTRVISGSFKSRLQAMYASDFPTLASPEGEICSLHGPTFREMIAKTRYAVSDKTDRYQLNGALLSLTPQGAAMVATDAKRVSLATMAYSGPEAQTIIPTKTLDLLVQGVEPLVEFSQTDRHLFFASTPRLLTSRRLDGKFPAYQRIIPKDNDKRLTVDRSFTAAALRRVLSVSDEELAVLWTIETGRLTLSSQSAAVGDAAEQVPVQYDGPALKVAVNGRFVLDFLEASTSMDIQVHLKDETGAMLLLDGANFLNVVLLMSQR